MWLAHQCFSHYYYLDNVGITKAIEVDQTRELVQRFQIVEIVGTLEFGSLCEKHSKIGMNSNVRVICSNEIRFQ